MNWLTYRRQHRVRRLLRTRRKDPLASLGKLSAPSQTLRHEKNGVRQRFCLGIVSAFLVFSVAACASLPDSGPVHEGQVDSDSRNPLAQLASGPIDGSSPEKLLADFQLSLIHISEPTRPY